MSDEVVVVALLALVVVADLFALAVVLCWLDSRRDGTHALRITRMPPRRFPI